DFDLKELVVLPREIDLNEWLACSTTTFFNLINLQYSTISEFCTGDTCPAMTKPIRCVDVLVLTSHQQKASNYQHSLVKKICRYLFHVLAHIYWSHYKETVAMDLHGHINTLYTHFVVFIREFNLMDPKETSIMDDLTEALCTPLPPQPQNHVTER
uniref:MOB kinase activator 2b n=1 Tax=Sinocyclocheilus rhinocerous TaxID=307959 RepID=A0A673JWU8_9TELE